jgi:hypothetical protein
MRIHPSRIASPLIVAQLLNALPTVHHVFFT